MTAAARGESEWLEADGLGGFAMGRVDQLRTRRYHAWLVAARRPPGDRVVLVHGAEVAITIAGQEHAVLQQRYAPGVLGPERHLELRAMTHVPWPRWTYALPGDDGAELVQELFVPHGVAGVVLSWRLRGARQAARLRVRPFLSGRGTHDSHHANDALSFDAARLGDDVVWRPYAGVPAVRARANGSYRHDPHWYRNFEYDEERARGLDCVEDLAAPGELTWELGEGEAFLLLTGEESPTRLSVAPATQLREWRAAETARRSQLGGGLRRAADAYIVARGDRRSIIAGYPWFSEWGRDTFIALRGLCIAGGRWSDARDILLEWSLTVSEGMLPNFFPEGGAPEYNSVDASLWFVVAVRDLLAAPEAAGGGVVPSERLVLEGAVAEIVLGYATGTRWGIRADADGLLAAGAAGTQLTWMDARAEGREITPRVGKPVEVQALWVNALLAAGRNDRRWTELAERARGAFVRRFWSDDRGYLADVVDVDHAPGTADFSLRPNQLFALGGLPVALLDGERARRAVDAVERALWTVAGPRSLAPGEPGYRGRCVGGVSARDSAYHQGTVWPWLTGAFVDAWVRVRGGGADVRREAHARFVEPLVAHYATYSLGHIAELADADPPHTPRGCPFQAWSVGEVQRLEVGD